MRRYGETLSLPHRRKVADRRILRAGTWVHHEPHVLMPGQLRSSHHVIRDSLTQRLRTDLPRPLRPHHGGRVDDLSAPESLHPVQPDPVVVEQDSEFVTHPVHSIQESVVVKFHFTRGNLATQRGGAFSHFVEPRLQLLT